MDAPALPGPCAPPSIEFSQVQTAHFPAADDASSIQVGAAPKARASKLAKQRHHPYASVDALKERHAEIEAQKPPPSPRAQAKAVQRAAQRKAQRVTVAGLEERIKALEQGVATNAAIPQDGSSQPLHTLVTELQEKVAKLESEKASNAQIMVSLYEAATLFSQENARLKGDRTATSPASSPTGGDIPGRTVEDELRDRLGVLESSALALQQLDLATKHSSLLARLDTLDAKITNLNWESSTQLAELQQKINDVEDRASQSAVGLATVRQDVANLSTQRSSGASADDFNSRSLAQDVIAILREEGWRIDRPGDASIDELLLDTLPDDDAVRRATGTSAGAHAELAQSLVDANAEIVGIAAKLEALSSRLETELGTIKQACAAHRDHSNTLVSGLMVLEGRIINLEKSSNLNLPSTHPELDPSPHVPSLSSIPFISGDTTQPFDEHSGPKVVEVLKTVDAIATALRQETASNLSHHVSHLQLQISGASEAISTLETQLRGIDEKVTKSDKHCARIAQHVLSDREANEEAFQELRERIKVLEADQTVTRVRELERRLDGVRGLVGRHADILGSLQTPTAKVAEDVTTLKASVEEMQPRLSIQLEEGVAGLRQELRVYSDAQEVLATKVSALDASVSSMVDQRSRAALTDLAKDVAALKSLVDDQAKSLRADISKSMERIARVEDDKKDLQATFAKVTLACADLAKHFSTPKSTPASEVPSTFVVSLQAVEEKVKASETRTWGNICALREDVARVEEVVRRSILRASGGAPYYERRLDEVGCLPPSVSRERLVSGRRSSASGPAEPRGDSGL